MKPGLKVTPRGARSNLSDLAQPSVLLHLLDMSAHQPRRAALEPVSTETGCVTNAVKGLACCRITWDSPPTCRLSGLPSAQSEGAAGIVRRGVRVLIQKQCPGPLLSKPAGAMAFRVSR